MNRWFDCRAERRRGGSLAALMLVVSLGVSDSAVADLEKTPIHRTNSMEAAVRVTPRNTSSGKTLAFLGLLLAGTIVARKVARRRRMTRPDDSLQGSIAMLARRQIDEDFTVRVLRVGPRILIVGSSPQGLATLIEVSDPSDIATITGAAPLADTNALAASSLDGRTAIRQTVLTDQQQAPSGLASTSGDPRPPHPAFGAPLEGGPSPAGGRATTTSRRFAA